MSEILAIARSSDRKAALETRALCAAAMRRERDAEDEETIESEAGRLLEAEQAYDGLIVRITLEALAKALNGGQ